MSANIREQFRNPRDEYTAIPFWFWNDEFTEDEIKRQIQDFKSKGIMGFVIHPRMGIPDTIRYLSDGYMHFVRIAVEEAHREGMIVFLYDEAMYPSGSANGLVVKSNPKYASRGLRMLEYTCAGHTKISIDLLEDDRIISIQAVEKLSDTEINPGTIEILDLGYSNTIEFTPPKDGNWSILIFTEIYSRGVIRGVHFGQDDWEDNPPPSADLLNPNAMKEFIDITYERYYGVLKEYFGNTIRAIFTDEPGIMGRGHIEGLMPWTWDFLDYYEEFGGCERDLGALWLDIGEETEQIRYRFNRAVNRRLEESYYMQISKWCEEHNVSLSGHPSGSSDIGMLKHFHIPGQDVVWRWVAPENGLALEGEESTQAKCSSDAARHMGLRRNSNECFGACGKDGIGYNFTGRDMKWYLDWLFVRGVNMIIPHAFYYSVKGERRIGERPPDVGPNNIWWPYYNRISDYIKRMCWLLSNSVNMAQVAVLCEDNYLPWKIVKPLYENQIEFNYLERDLLISNSCKIADGKILIERQKYRILLIEEDSHIDELLLERIGLFIDTGGIVIILDRERDNPYIENVIYISIVEEVVGAIGRELQPDIFIEPGDEDLRITHLEIERKHFYILVNEGEEDIQGNIYIDVIGRLEIWEPWEGKMEPMEADLEGEYMKVSMDLERRQSLILFIDPNEEMDHIEGSSVSPGEERILRLDDNWKIYRSGEGLNPNLMFQSWTNWPLMEDFSGTIRYETSINIESMEGISSIILDLGAVHEIAHIYVNGKDRGFKLWPPYKFDLTEAIGDGANELVIEVTNTMANRLDKAKLESGLLGPTKLNIYLDS